MGLLDKAINKVIDWESVDVSVDDMAAKIEALYSGCSEKEIRKLRFLAKKTWVLAVGNGSSVRYCTLQGGKYKVMFDYSLFTHLISTIQLYDNENKVNYFIPKGRANARELQRRIVAGIAQSGKV